MKEERIAEIKKMLEGISPAPWWADFEPQDVIYIWDGAGNHVAQMTADNVSNANLIAAAPTVIAELLQEVESLRADNEAIVVAWLKDTGRGKEAARADYKRPERDTEQPL